MQKSLAAKRGAGRDQRKAPQAPPAKKPRKDPMKPVTLEKENIFLQQNAPMEPEKKKFVAQEIPSDPVSQRVALVQSAFEDERPGGLLALPSYICEMLRIAVPTSLGHGSAADERHAIQTTMAETIGAYLQQVTVICEESVKEHEKLLQIACSTKEEGQSLLAAQQRQLEEKALLVQQKQANYDFAERAVSDAKQKISQTEVDTLDEQVKQTLLQRDKYQKVLTSSFDVLKACDWSSAAEQKKGEKKLFGPLNTLLKQIDADPSLVEAASNALAKNPAQRGDFDMMVVKQLEDVLREPLAVLDEQVRQQENIKQEKLLQMQEVKAAVALAEEQLGSCEAELVACKKEHQQLECRVHELQEAARDPDLALEQARSAHDAKLSLLKKAKEISAAFRFLYERRIAPLPEPAPPVVLEPLEGVETPAGMEREKMEVEPLESEQTAGVMETEKMEVESQHQSVMEMGAECAEVSVPPETCISSPTMSDEPSTQKRFSCPVDAGLDVDIDPSTQKRFSCPVDAGLDVAIDPSTQKRFSCPVDAGLDVDIDPSTQKRFSCPVEAGLDVDIDPSTQKRFSCPVDAGLDVDVPMLGVESQGAHVAADVTASPVEDEVCPSPSELPSTALEMVVEESSAVEAMGSEAPAEEPAAQTDPCWEFVPGLEPGSDPFSDRKSTSEDLSTLKQECKELNAMAVTTAGLIKFNLPPRNEWVPPRDEDDDFGTWVWKGDVEAEMPQALH